MSLPANRDLQDAEGLGAKAVEHVGVQVDGVSAGASAPVSEDHVDAGAPSTDADALVAPAAGTGGTVIAPAESGSEGWPGSSVRSAGRMDSHTVVSPVVNDPAVETRLAEQELAASDWGWAIPSYGRRRGGRLGGRSRL
jgi:hypothetical protein